VAWAARGEPLAGRLLAAYAIATVLLAAKGIVLLELGVSVPFGVLHVLWLDLVVAIPLTAILLLALTRGAGGLHELDGRWIYVSRGVGAERAQAPRLRLGAVPEVSLITLR
jgi:hypothetical protein